MTFLTHMLEKHKQTAFAILGVILILLIYIISTTFAAPPGSPYNEAETLDPSCSPGDLNCSVQDQWNNSGNDIYNTNTGNVGIGTASPGAKLEVIGTSGTSPLRVDTDTQTNALTVSDGTGAFKSYLTVNGDRAISFNYNNFDNTFLGWNAGTLAANNGNSVAVGTSALGSLANGYQNVAVGNSAGASITDAGSSVFVGYLAGTATTAGGNTFVGANSGQTNTAGTSNTALGYTSLQNSTGNDNTATGSGAMQTNTTGSNNEAFGKNALFFNTTGNQNTAFGSLSLQANTTADGNAGFGYRALTSNTTGNANTAMGHNALAANETGYENSAFGTNALSSNIIGIDNTSIGDNTLVNNTGSSNTALGKTALLFNTIGEGNVGIGNQALYNQTTGSGNIALGLNAGYWNTTVSDQLFIDNAYNFNRADYDENKTNGLVYGTFGGTPDAQTFRVNASLGVNVSPTASIQSIGFGNDSTTYSMKLENSDLDDLFFVRNDGSVGIGTATPDASALLDVSSATKGFLPPRMTTAQMNDISSPAPGLIIYNTSIDIWCGWNNTATWVRLDDSTICS